VWAGCVDQPASAVGDQGVGHAPVDARLPSAAGGRVLDAGEGDLCAVLGASVRDGADAEGDDVAGGLPLAECVEGGQGLRMRAEKCIGAGVVTGVDPLA